MGKELKDIELADLRHVDTSKVKHYYGEQLMLPIREREKLAKKK
jgi:hypothetical protein